MVTKTKAAAKNTAVDTHAQIKRYLIEIAQMDGWKVTYLGADAADVANPAKQHTTVNLRGTIAAAVQNLQALGWDPRAAERTRKGRAAAALDAARELNDKKLAEAEARATERHAAEMANFKAHQPPGTLLPDGTLVDYLSKPVFYTPFDALALLRATTECTCNLRAISKVNEERIAQEITSGGWVYSPQGVCLCVHGNVGDGKHRLDTLSRMSEEDLTKLYGAPGLWIRTTFGVAPEVLDTFDSGKARDGANVLMQHGFTQHPKELNTAVKQLIAYEQGIGWRSWNRTVITPRQRLQALHGQYARLAADPSEPGTPLYNALRLHRRPLKVTLSSALTFVYLMQSVASPEDCEAFLLPLLTGKALEDKDPRFSLFAVLVGKEKRPAEASAPIRQLGLLIKGWNKWATGEDQTLSTFKKTEPMPVIKPVTREIPRPAAVTFSA